MLKALADAIKERPSLASLRLSTLNTWFAKDNIRKYLELYYRLGDKDSKNTFLRLLYNSIGLLLAGDMERFHNISAEKWKALEKEAALLNSYIHSYTLDLIETFILEGYSYKDICGVTPGDVVLDCGAYTGNTAVYFAERSAPDGMVYSFEPMPSNFSALKTNIENSNFQNISTFQLAIADSCGQVYFTESGSPGSRKVEKSNLTVPQATIDDFVSNNGLPNVDFIKMDIEGSENQALIGASEVIKRFHPKLAICIYHRPDDFITIPNTILNINPNYQFYLKQNSYNFWETVLFAAPTSTPAEIIIDEEEEYQTQEVWNAIHAVHASRIKLQRKHLLEQYTNPIVRKYPQLGAPIFDTSGGGNYYYAYWPLSEDRRLHYEYLFSGDSCEISLHFEGAYSKYSELIEEICKISVIPLRNNPGRWKGCSIVCADIKDVNKVVSYMDYLIRLTFPILYKRRLLSERNILNPININ